ncbi:vesicle-associated membrane protein 5 [Ctenopharyngodon idella]|uniref:vesicle-associated membrane protein 5 n=1 Tax=Ctenopharyngodon idella TaxID=7959 RepID=UPI002231D9FD|nr:vesicle-associated membrane protein 5 [Ctenopharyngodon idella]
MNGQSRLQQAQEDVEEVKVIMLDNLNKTEERSEKLKELDDRADKLLQQSDKFVKTATKVKQKKRWENIKYKVIMGAVVAAVILLGIIILAVSLSGSDGSQNTSQMTQSTKAPGDG